MTGAYGSAASRSAAAFAARRPASEPRERRASRRPVPASLTPAAAWYEIRSPAKANLPLCTARSSATRATIRAVSSTLVTSMSSVPSPQ